MPKQPNQAKADFCFHTLPKQKPTDEDNRIKKPSKPRKLKIEPKMPAGFLKFDYK